MKPGRGVTWCGRLRSIHLIGGKVLEGLAGDANQHKETQTEH